MANQILDGVRNAVWSNDERKAITVMLGLTSLSVLIGAFSQIGGMTPALALPLAAAVPVRWAMARNCDARELRCGSPREVVMGCLRGMIHGAAIIAVAVVLVLVLIAISEAIPELPFRGRRAVMLMWLPGAIAAFIALRCTRRWWAFGPAATGALVCFSVLGAQVFYWVVGGVVRGFISAVPFVGSWVTSAAQVDAQYAARGPMPVAGVGLAGVILVPVVGVVGLVCVRKLRAADLSRALTSQAA